MSLKNILVSSFISAGLIMSVAHADTWQLDSDNSELNFVSVKNDHVAEVHRFTELQGEWKNNTVTIEIPVVSLDTQIPIRNERMLEHLFNSNEYPIVSAKATLEDTVLLDMPVGGTMPLSADMMVYIAGDSDTVSAHMQVTRISENRFLATTTQPIIINTSAFSLVSGIDKLREIAGLARIDYAVPVTFSVQFSR
ncbi:YceI family protein [Pseudidiomarina sp.]|uniref:YceI family protein n=1 Tax=Pseudidiomarina sp. TaxID=2081707 RepID=UPI003A97D99E